MELIRVEQGRGRERGAVPFSQTGRRVQSRMVRPGEEDGRMRTGRKKGVGVGGLGEGAQKEEKEGGRGSVLRPVRTGHSELWLSSFSGYWPRQTHQGAQKGLSPGGCQREVKGG